MFDQRKHLAQLLAHARDSTRY